MKAWEVDDVRRPYRQRSFGCSFPPPFLPPSLPSSLLSSLPPSPRYYLGREVAAGAVVAVGVLVGIQRPLEPEEGEGADRLGEKGQGGEEGGRGRGREGRRGGRLRDGGMK